MTTSPAAPVLPDPYTPGEVPRVLVGRVAELDRIRDQLGRVSTFGEVGGPPLVFHAPRGIGKTSLLRTAQRTADETGFVTAWVACSRERPFLPELVHSVSRALARADLATGARRRWRDRLEEISLELGVAGVSVGADVRVASEAAPSTGSAPISALEDLLHEAATAVRDRHGAGLVVFLDELHAASADDLSTLLNALQNLAGERAANPLAVVTAGLPVTPEAITRAATFGERSTFVPLDLLNDADARALLVVPAEALGVTWSARALDLLAEECKGHPYLLQLLGSATWRSRTPAAGDELVADDVRAGVPLARQQLDAMYRARWGSATPTEQSFLVAMAAVGTDNVTRADIAAGMGRDSRAISGPRERLIEKGVIEPVGHGLVRFTLPGFGDYVTRRSQGE